MMLVHQKLYLLLSGDSLHDGSTSEEVVESMRQAMYTVPSSIQAYMEGVRDRARMVDLGEVDVSSVEAFLESLVRLDLAQWLTEAVVRERFGSVLVEKKKMGWEWVLRKKR